MLSEKLDMVFFMVTLIPSESSRVLWSGDSAEEVLKAGFQTDIPSDGRGLFLRGVVSRKQQFLPAIVEGISMLGSD